MPGAVGRTFPRLFPARYNGHPLRPDGAGRAVAGARELINRIALLNVSFEFVVFKQNG